MIHERRSGEDSAHDDANAHSAEETCRALRQGADLAAEYLIHAREYPVLPKIAPGDVRRALPDAPPQESEPLDRILEDYKRLIEPNVTHWNHPGFLAYFANSGSLPGIIGETLAAAINNNAMLWRTGPASTELEEVTTDWLRQMMELPPGFRGHINDTASISSLVALAAARHQVPGLDIRERGMAGRADLPPLTIYCSDQAHSSIDKAAVMLGLGMQNVRRVPVDDAFQMRPAALADVIASDRAAGKRPFAVIATVGTTSTTSVDPVRAVAEVCRREGLWLHADAAYAGSAAICPEYRALMDGLELADSIVTNPHKWLFTPMDCSVLFVRDVRVLKDAFSLVPEYLRTDEAGATNLMDYGIQLGRRFRSLKLWMVLRAFGVKQLQAIIREHCRLAQEFRSWVDGEKGFEISAPTPFSVVCFRATPPDSPHEQDRFNERLLNQVNAAGPFFLSHTKLHGRFVLRVAIGNIQTKREHVAAAWECIRNRHAASRLRNSAT